METFKIHYEESGNYKAKASMYVQAEDKAAAIAKVKAMHEAGQISDSDKMFDYETADFDAY